MPKAVLIGPPGAGKSSVGRQLAKLWECDIFDSDAEIERVSGKKIADIFTIQSSYWVAVLCFAYLILYAFLTKKILGDQIEN